MKLPTPGCLIRHDAQWMIWDTGNGDRPASVPGGEIRFGGRFTQPRTLAGQLAEPGLRPSDIDYVGISHLHQDHTANIPLFKDAAFLISAAEPAWARGNPTPFGVEAPSIAPLNAARLEPLEGDRDVFGDGTVQILRAPGHTPGSAMLLVRIPKSGPVLLSGDVFHTRENYEKNLVPGVNTNRAESLASSQRFRGVVANTDARVVIQHAPEDFASLPAFPEYPD
ncbi:MULTISPECIES: N-acyl homoserine lactonase family protein [unclassified Streptomyces]|uniref:N-acyl homoserine lactonase family protein n=1 Tax=unclassified Streptomyces TaxID=2593676 RepID=UPI00117EDC9C|nr:N-acyl homoserine lactonase family protein [Streptomyces sp. 13-12-16]